MASPKSLDALEKIGAALKDLQENHITKLLANLDSSKHPRVQAQAKAALALTMGTLRFMGARLRGMESVDPQLRKELNQMRKLLVAVQKKHDDTINKAPAKGNDESSEKKEANRSGEKQKATDIEQPRKKRKKIGPHASMESENTDK